MPLLPSQELVEYYQSHSLKESFKQLDTTLKYPYKSRERSTSRTFTRSPGKPSLALWKTCPFQPAEGIYSFTVGFELLSLQSPSGGIFRMGLTRGGGIREGLAELGLSGTAAL